MNRSRRFTLFVLLYLSLLLSACQAGEAPLATTLPEEPPQASLSPSKPPEIVVPSATSEPEPSVTPRPSSTPSLPSATSDWTAFDLDARSSISPDGMWVARVIVARPPQDSGGVAYHTLVRVDSASDPRSWTVVDEWLAVGLGMTTPTVLRWTEDGSSLFIADTGVPDGCGPSFMQNVRHVDLQTGQVTPLDEELFGKLSVSPDGSTLVAFSQDAGLVVHDLSGGEQREIGFVGPEGDWWPGEIVWSPDGREFLFDLSLSPCSAPEAVTSSVWHSRLEGDETLALIQDEPRQLSLQSWPEACLAQVNDREGGVWWLDPCTGSFNQSPPEEVSLALDALLGFFDALYQEKYVEAVEYYGGTYESLQNNNPSIDPDDHAALLSNACLFNGYQCLPVLSYVLTSRPGPDEFRFSVTFDREGEAFVLGPCCGASPIDQPPVSQFTYTVKIDDAGAYRVQELPVYVP